MNVMDPKHLYKSPEQDWTLPARAYTDPAMFAQERERIFFRTWQYVGHACDLRQPGDYLTARIVDENVFVVRTSQGGLKAFYNVCRHRAHALLKGSGRLGPLITCPYHAWAYDLEGHLRGARGAEIVDGFDNGDFALEAVRVEALKGLVFVNLDPDAAPLAESYPGLAEELEASVPHIDNMDRVPGDTFTYAGEPGELRTNWKVLLDNSLECYHCGPAHPAFADLVDLATYKIAENGTFTTHMAKARPDNSAYAFEATDPVQRVTFWHLWPNAIVALMPGAPNLGMYKFTPTSHDRTAIHYDSFRLPGPVSERERARMKYTADVLWPEDEALCESVWRGLHSRSYRQGRLMVNGRLNAMTEEPVKFFHCLWAKAMSFSGAYGDLSTGP